ncbi:hypothetical protein [Spirosoma pulveris]
MTTILYSNCKALSQWLAYAEYIGHQSIFTSGHYAFSLYLFYAHPASVDPRRTRVFDLASVMVNRRFTTPAPSLPAP